MRDAEPRGVRKTGDSAGEGLPVRGCRGLGRGTPGLPAAQVLRTHFYSLGGAGGTCKFALLFLLTHALGTRMLAK